MLNSWLPPLWLINQMQNSQLRLQLLRLKPVQRKLWLVLQQLLRQT